MINKPFFIEIEAPEFGGKTTLIDNLKIELKSSNLNWSFIRLPGFTEFGEECRKLLKYYNASDEARLGLAFAAHMDAYKNMDPMQNYIVDRALNSCVVYQGYFSKLKEKRPDLFNIFIKTIKQEIDKNFNRYVIYLDITAEEILKRRNKNIRKEEIIGKKDIYDSLSLDKMLDLVYYYKKAIFDSDINSENKLLCINAALSPKEISNIAKDWITNKIK